MSFFQKAIVLVGCVSALIVSVFGSRVASGASIRYYMSGQITVVNDSRGDLPGDVYIGAPFTAQLSYDSDVLDGLPDDPNRGAYSMGSCAQSPGLIFSIGTQTIACDPSGGLFLEVENDVSAPPFYPPDTGPPGDYLLAVTRATGLALPFWRMQAGMRMDDLSLGAFSNDSLPLKLEIDSFQNRYIFASGYLSVGTLDDSAPTPSFEFVGAIDTLVPVSEPSSFLLSVVGIGSILVPAILRRRFLGRDLRRE
jgi:hypothetical protein